MKATLHPCATFHKRGSPKELKWYINAKLHNALTLYRVRSGMILSSKDGSI